MLPGHRDIVFQAPGHQQMVQPVVAPAEGGTCDFQIQPEASDEGVVIHFADTVDIGVEIGEPVFDRRRIVQPDILKVDHVEIIVAGSLDHGRQRRCLRSREDVFVDPGVDRPGISLPIVWTKARPCGLRMCAIRSKTGAIWALPMCSTMPIEATLS